MIGYIAILVALVVLYLAWTNVFGYLGLITKVVLTVALLGVAYWGYSSESAPAVPAYMPTTGMMGGSKRKYRR
jgi:hypothetical protein